MNEEKRLAEEAYRKMKDAIHESYVKVIYDSYIDSIRRKGLDESSFIRYLRNLFSLIGEAQTPEQTNRNTLAAMALLQGGKK